MLAASPTMDDALSLGPCHLWPYLDGRTLWLLGDSHVLDLYRALSCFLLVSGPIGMRAHSAGCLLLHAHRQHAAVSAAGVG